MHKSSSGLSQVRIYAVEKSRSCCANTSGMEFSFHIFVLSIHRVLERFQNQSFSKLFLVRFSLSVWVASDDVLDTE